MGELLMSIRINIENILKSKDAVFLEIIKRLTEKSINDCKIVLERNNHGIDTVLFDAITLVLSDLNSEVGYINKLLYGIFEFEIKKNIRREQLIILGGQLKAQHSILKKDIYVIELQIETINSTIKNLRRLQIAFQDKNMFVIDDNILKKSQLYIEKIDIKIWKLKESKESLKNKSKLLKKNERTINTLFKKIPRYHKLREENCLYLSK
jgi:chaperonin cofactor prefoldin